MKKTRDRILFALLQTPRSSVAEIAEQVGINAISVRHHLTNLQAEGLILLEEERHGVGRPRLVYSLSCKGLEKFPSKYLKLTSKLLSIFEDKFSENEMKGIMDDLGSSLIEDYPNIHQLQLPTRLDEAQNILAQGSYSFLWEEKPNGDFLIYEISCPYRLLVEDHPIVCFLGKKLIENLIGENIEKIEPPSTINACCTYRICSNGKSRIS
jgi:predicted ArsR family transcriptional regulator